jgi:hypothetical protein
MDMINEIGGGRSVGGTGASYGEGYAYEAIRERIKKIIESFMAL